MYYYELDVTMRNVSATYDSQNSNNFIFNAILNCLAVYATVWLILSKVLITTVDLSLPIPNRVIKPGSADGTAKAGE